MIIKNVKFETSVGIGGTYPSDGRAEIAMVGRSNVGKSSLINKVCGNNKLAKTSQRPGKTRLINYFDAGGEYYIVDLPGYGFAEAPKSEIEKWGDLIEEYLSSKRVAHLFLLVDIRHAPTAQDKQMLQWILYYSIPYTIIATKADKISKAQRAARIKALSKELSVAQPPICFSSEDGVGADELVIRIEQIVTDFKNLH